MSDDRSLPHDIETEKVVLGALIVSGLEVYKTIEDKLAVDGLFYRDAHRRIFRAIVTCYADHGDADFLLVKKMLEREGELDEVGGPAYISALTDGVPRMSNIEQYVDILRQKGAARKLVASLKKGLTDAFEGWDAVDAADRVKRDLDAIRDSAGELDDFKHVGAIYTEDVAPDLEARVSSFTERRPFGISTGYSAIDAYTGGLQPKDLIILAARPSKGKTTLAMNMAEYVAGTYNLPAAVFSLEMGKEQLFYRMLCGKARVNFRYVRRGEVSETEMFRIGQAASELSETPIYINDLSGLSAADIVARARRLKRKQGGLGVVLIDYIQLMHERERFQNRNIELAKISATLKAGAKELDVPFVVLSQLSRPERGVREKRPVLSDLRDSGALEQDADVVMFIHRDENPDDDGLIGVAEIIVAKQRNGPTGTAKLAFIPEFTRFENQEL